jgi:hypothetical protein
VHGHQLPDTLNADIRDGGTHARVGMEVDRGEF